MLPMQKLSVECSDMGEWMGASYSFDLFNVFSDSHAIAHVAGEFGQGDGVIWLDELKCNGSEVTLADCGMFKKGFSDCRHEEDVGVSCLGHDKPTPTPVDSGLDRFITIWTISMLFR